MALSDQIKTPYISLFDGLGNQLATSDPKGDVSVVSLRYRFDDEDDDRCLIKLQTSEPKAFDSLGIGRGSRLLLKWGYVEGPISSQALVAVKDITSKYGREVIYTEIEASDLISYLKTAKSAEVGKDKLIHYLISICDKRYNLVIMDRGNPIFSMGKDKKQVPEDVKEEAQKVSPYHGEKTTKPTTYQPFFDPFEELFRGTVTGEVLDFLGPRGRWWVFAKNEIRDYLESEKPILSTSRSQFTTIQDLLKEAPFGPWYVMGRGETIIIHNRYLNRKPFRSYRYHDEPGYLMDFTAKTKYENFEKEAISYAGIDPHDKKMLFFDEYKKALDNTRDLKEIITDEKITDVQKATEIREYLDLRYSAYPKFGARIIEGAFLDPGKDSQFYLGGRFKYPFVKKLGMPPEAISDNTRVDTDPYVKNRNETFNPSIHDPVLRAYFFALPHISAEAAQNVINNRQRKLEMEKEEATIIIEGDPAVQDTFNIEIKNVHKQHEGIYYAKKVEHTITKEGYKTTIEALKVMPEAKLITIRGEAPTVEEVEAQWKQERLLFGKDIIFTFQETRFNEVQYESDPSRTYQKGEKVPIEESLNDMLFNQGLSKDELISKILGQYQSPSFKIEENINVENR